MNLQIKKAITISVMAFFISCNSENKEDFRHKERSILDKVLDDSVDSLGTNEYWTNNPIHSATLYVYCPECVGGYDDEIIENEKLFSEAIIDSLTKTVRQEDVILLNKMLQAKTNYMEDMVASCFEPHHGMVFKNKGGNIIGQISICFACNQYRMGEHKANYIPMKLLKKIIEKYNVPINGGAVRTLFRENHSDRIPENPTH